jgi:integrase
MMILRKIISEARKHRLLSYDPFSDYRIAFEETSRERLDSKEIGVLMAVELKGEMDMIRDLFVFCTFTGLAYIDLRTLREEDIHRDNDGHVWIVKNRIKTGVESVVRLMDIPKRILEKYEGLGTNGYVFPVPKYHKLLNGIKAIAKSCGIDKNVIGFFDNVKNLSQSNTCPFAYMLIGRFHRTINSCQIILAFKLKPVSSEIENRRVHP